MHLTSANFFTMSLLGHLYMHFVCYVNVFTEVQAVLGFVSVNSGFSFP